MYFRRLLAIPILALAACVPTLSLAVEATVAIPKSNLSKCYANSLDECWVKFYCWVNDGPEQGHEVTLNIAQTKVEVSYGDTLSCQAELRNKSGSGPRSSIASATLEPLTPEKLADDALTIIFN